VDVFAKALSEKLATCPQGAGSVGGVDGWAFFPKELSHLAAHPALALGNKPGDPIPAIVDFKNQLQAAGIDLLLVPVPPKAVIYPDKLASGCPAPPPLPAAYQEGDRAIYRELSSQGVRVLDLGDAFSKARSDDPAHPVYCRMDTHWSPAGIELAAGEIVKKVGAPPWMQVGKTESWPLVSSSNSFVGDLACLTNGATSEENVVLKTLAKPGDNADQLASVSRQSPVVLLGDSHNLVFHSGGDMHGVGGGLPDHLAVKMGIPVDLVAVRGSGATAVRWSLARRHDNLAGKKLVIWCFTSRDFTEGGRWDKVPVIKGKSQGSP